HSPHGCTSAFRQHLFSVLVRFLTVVRNLLVVTIEDHAFVISGEREAPKASAPVAGFIPLYHGPDPETLRERFDLLPTEWRKAECFIRAREHVDVLPRLFDLLFHIFRCWRWRWRRSRFW